MLQLHNVLTVGESTVCVCFLNPIGRGSVNVVLNCSFANDLRDPLSKLRIGCVEIRSTLSKVLEIG